MENQGAKYSLYDRVVGFIQYMGSFAGGYCMQRGKTDTLDYITQEVHNSRIAREKRKQQLESVSEMNKRKLVKNNFRLGFPKDW